MGESSSASCLTRWTNYGEKRRYCDATSHRSAEDHAPLELHLRDKAANKYVFGNFGVCAVSHPLFHNNETLTNLVSNLSLSLYVTLRLDPPRFPKTRLSPSSSAMTQMTLANMPKEVFTLNPFLTSLPQAGNLGIFLQVRDTMHIPEMCRITLVCNPCTASLKMTHMSPLAGNRRQGDVASLYLGHLCNCRGLHRLSYTWMGDMSAKFKYNLHY